MKAMRFAAVLASLMCVPAVAFAHGASRLKDTESVEINAPPAKVWKVMGNFHDMSWLPGVVSTTGTGDNTPGVAKRVITLKGGATVEESLYKYDAADMSYSYAIDKVDLKVLPVTNYSSTLVVLPDGDKSKVEWRGAFFRGDPNFNPPPDLSDDAAMKGVSGLYKAGLAGLKKKVESPEATN
jgi:carbon monoxide dehydrogenase subunit G